MPDSERRRGGRIPLVCEVVDIVERLFPPALAEDWDNVGLLLGEPNAPVRQVCVALDATVDAVKQAATKGRGALICHHPLFLGEALRKINFSSPTGEIIQMAAKLDVAVIAAHTNADWGIGGTNDTVAHLLGLNDIRPLETLYPERFRKLIVFVPALHVEKVSEAIFQAGAGEIGDYVKCSYRTDGHGTYLPLAGAEPYAGKVGKLSVEPEIRLEVRVPENKVEAVLAAMNKAHPYEEVAFDLYPTEKQDPQGGRGRIGALPKPITLAAFARAAAKRLGVKTGRMVGDPKQVVSEVAVSTGAGSFLMDSIMKKPGTVLVTGDLKYHDACKARDAGLAVVDLGHYGTELPFVDALVPRLASGLRELGKPVPVKACRPSGDPFRNL